MRLMEVLLRQLKKRDTIMLLFGTLLMFVGWAIRAHYRSRVFSSIFGG